MKCAPWCVDGTGHGDVSHPDDQWCHTDERRVFLSVEGLVEYGKGDWRLGHVGVYALRETHSRRPIIQVLHNEVTAMTLTADEARQLGNSLLIFAGAVDHS